MTQFFTFFDNYLLLGILAFTAVAISWEDYRTKKIRNKWIAVAIACGIVVHLAAMLLYFVVFKNRGIEINFSYYGRIIVNTGISFVVSFVLWKTGIWSAGDGKLFIAFAFLLPLQYYSRGYTEFFPASALLINIFFTLFIITILHTIIVAIFKPASRISGQEQKKTNIGAKLIGSFKENWETFATMFILFTFIFSSATIIRKKLEIYGLSALVNIVLLLMMFAIFKPLSEYMRKNFKKYAVLKYSVLTTILVVMWILVRLELTDFGQILRNAKTMAIFMIGVGSLLKAIDYLIEKTEVEKRSLKELEASEIITEKCLKDIKSGKYKLDLGTTTMDGLTQEQLWEIAEKYDEQQQFDTYKTLPFAPMASLGVLVTCVLKASIIHYALKNLF